jgi:Na+/H+-dicarboxylate symporter
VPSPGINARMKFSPTKLALHWQILIAIVFGIGAGHFSGIDGAAAGVRYYDVYSFFGTLFLNALKMLIVPLVTASLITGIAGMEQGDNFGRIGAKTLGYYLLSSLIAILVGLAAVNLVQPGIVDGAPAGALLHLDSTDPAVSAALAHVEDRGAGDFSKLFLDLVPPNIVAAAAEGQMLGLISFSLLFGYFMVRVGARQAQVMRDFWQGVCDVMMAITMLVMRFAPLGVFGLVAKTVAATGFAAFGPLLAFFLVVVAALACHFLIVLPLLLRWLGRVRPYRHIRAMAPALLTAFSTASSSATLPVNMECL